MEKQFNLNLFETMQIENQKYSEILTLPSGKPMVDGEVIIYRNFLQS